jgi:hypothetical protein
VRLRDVMTGIKRDGGWACDTCRTFTCQGCKVGYPFEEIAASVARLYPDERQEPIDMAREIARDMSDREWVCATCLDGGYEVDTSAHEVASSEPDVLGPRDDPYEDMRLHCKDCQASFVFSAREQKVWYEEYGIPRYYEGLWGWRQAVTRTRCDACQRTHVAQKRIGKILDGRASNLEYAATHRELEELYATLGNANKAGYHRNIARRLEGGDD